MSGYVNPWLFNGDIFDTEDIQKDEGFVYLIKNNLSGRRYIGRKYFWNIRKVKGKKQRQRTESDWKNYYGSSLLLKEDVIILKSENFSRNILSIHKTRGDCNRTEVELQWKINVLYEGDWYNDAIGHYKKVPGKILSGRRVSELFYSLIERS